MAAEQPRDVESLLRSALRPIEPPENLPGRVEETTYMKVEDLEAALKRAAAAHGEHEARTGQADENWPAWYAAYMFAEGTGTELPQ